MAVRPASLVFALLVATAVGTSVWMVFHRPATEPAPVPAPAAGGGGTPSAPAPGSGPTPPDATAKKGPKTARPRPKSPPPEPVDPVAATRDGCLAFLRQHASPVPPGKGGKGTVVRSDLRTEAMDALALADPAAAEPLVLQALGGDGDPSDWSDERLHAAGIRIRAGKADGAETVKAFLKSGEDLDFVAGETARAASWLPPADGGPVVRRLLALKLEDYDEDDLVAILQAAAALGVGATAERLRPLAAAGPDGALEASVRGAAAGALLRLGDGTGKEVLKDLDETDAADVARGLGARGNEAAFPLLEELLRSEDGDTRAGAARGIADVGGPRAMDGLRRALKDPEEDVRAWAAVGLANLGARDGVAEVRKAAAGKDVWLAIAAWKALAVVGDAESRDAAAKVLAGEVKRVPPLDRHTELMLRVWAAAVIVRTGK